MVERMLSKMEKLQREAEDAARFRGHNLNIWDWHPFGLYNKTQCKASCQRCSAVAYIDTTPLANSIEIGGDAVAINCGGK